MLLIRILKPTVAKPAGEAARAVEPGEEILVDDAQGKQMVGLGKAERFVDGPETATVGPSERAVMPPAKRKRG